MRARHGVVHRDVIFVLHGLHADGVRRVRRFRFQLWQGEAAATDHRRAHGADRVAADRADVKAAPEQVGGAVAVLHVRAGQQFQHGEAQRPGQGFQQAYVGEAVARLPFADGLAADKELLCQFLLGQAPGLPHPADYSAGDISVHKNRLRFRHKYPTDRDKTQATLRGVPVFAHGCKRDVDKVPTRSYNGPVVFCCADPRFTGAGEVKGCRRPIQGVPQRRMHKRVGFWLSGGPKK